jgi:nucleotide-binding universal stress UspA family protein
MPHIVVGVDNSEGSRRALEWAVVHHAPGPVVIVPAASDG